MHALETIGAAKVAESMTRTAVADSITEPTIKQEGEFDLEKRETDDAAVDLLVDSYDTLTTKLTSISLASATGVLMSYLKRKPPFEIAISPLSKVVAYEWEKYSKQRAAQDEEMKTMAIGGRYKVVPKNEHESDIPYGYAFVITIPSLVRKQIYGPVRFTRKVAQEAAAMDAVRFLYVIGELNEHLLTKTVSMKKKGPALSFVKELQTLMLANTKKVTVVKENLNNDEEIIQEVDPDTGKVLNEYFAFQFDAAIPSNLAPSKQWKDLCDAIGHNTTKGRAESAKAVVDDAVIDVYITVLTVESRSATLGILTTNPLPLDRIPPYVFTATHNISGEVSLLQYSNLPSYGYQKPTAAPLSLRKSELRDIAMYHTYLWNYVNHEYTAVTGEAAFSKDSRNLAYFVVPMINNETDEIIYNWSIDWNMIYRVVNHRTGPVLYDVLTSVLKNINKAPSTNSNKRRKLSLSSASLSTRDNGDESQQDNHHSEIMVSFEDVFDELVGDNRRDVNPLEASIPNTLSKLGSHAVEAFTTFLQNTMLITPHNMYTYGIQRLSETLKPLSPFEIERFSGVHTYKDYFEKQGYKITHTDEPLAEVYNADFIRSSPINGVDPPISTSRTLVFLSMDAARVLPIPHDFYNLVLQFPLMMFYVEKYCLAEDIRQKLSPHLDKVSSSTLLEAITATNATDAVNYERLEIYGDAFLKLAKTADLYDRFPEYGEGELTDVRSKVVANANLAVEAKRRGFGGYLQVHPFRAKSWLPPGFERAKSANEIAGSGTYGKRKVNEKRLADIIEALLGAVCFDVGTDAALGLLAEFKFIDVTTVAKLCERKESSTTETNCIAKGSYPSAFSLLVEEQKENLDALENSLGYKFQDRKLALEALSHSSKGHAVSYERLEFLGDALLDWMLMRYFFQTYTEYGPELLSEMRAASVNNESLCRIAVELNLHKLLMYDVAYLKAHLDLYIGYLERPGVKDLPLSEAAFDGPKALGDTLEALIGAVFIDASSSIEKTWEVFKPHLLGFLERYIQSEVSQKSIIRQMHEHLQSMGYPSGHVKYQYVLYLGSFDCGSKKWQINF
jgi:dsRNA-specific ribonuclease